MSCQPVLTGERFSHTAAAIFASESSARHAAEALRSAIKPNAAHVNLLLPGHEPICSALETERKGVLLGLIRAHLWFALFGGVFGVVLFALLSSANIPWIDQSPWPAAAAVITFGVVAGLLFGGLITLRPDQNYSIEAVRRANGDGCTIVIVHVDSGKVCAEAEQTLGRLGGKALRTL
jgi:hypothetical protein